ncbi:MAG: type VI secretion system tip protein VgrG [Tannerellaceae bacterium]|nr:type VI secretion system tip protein VgrG [Tannerellaceae bacterium]
MADASTKSSDGVIRVSVSSAGEGISTSLFALISVTIRKEVNRIGRAVLVFDAGNMPEGEIPESDDDSFAPGNTITIEAGYGDDEHVLYEGIVINHQLVITGRNESTLQIECCDYLFSATEVRKNKIFANQKDSEIIEEILEEYSGLTVSVDATTTQYGELIQYYCTDWDFILSRAEANGLIVLSEGATVTVKEPALSETAKLTITYGTDLIAFHGELTAEAQPQTTKATAWDMSTQQLVTVTGATPTLNKQGTGSVSDLAEATGNNQQICQTAFAEDSDALQAWADARVVRAGLSRIRGYCTFVGNHTVLPGDLIELNGLGSRFNGSAFVGWIEHEIKEGDWTTTAGLGMPVTTITEKPDVMAPSASGLLPGIKGLHIGKVTKLDSDPDDENRIQVEIPLLNQGEEDNHTVWARLGSLWASNYYGTFFIPDIGDEVILGFFNEDPCYPVILGSLYSSSQPPPYEITQDNTIRAIYTKSEMKIEFDEEDKVITIETPGENKIQISDDGESITLEDQHTNKIMMNEKGIKIISASDIVLQADSNIKLEAGSGIKQTATSDITCKGKNFEAKADASLTLKGNTKAELSASGQTVVKGAMVKIN